MRTELMRAYGLHETVLEEHHGGDHHQHGQHDRHHGKYGEITDVAETQIREAHTQRDYPGEQENNHGAKTGHFLVVKERVEENTETVDAQRRHGEYGHSIGDEEGEMQDVLVGFGKMVLRVGLFHMKVDGYGSS